MAQNSTLLATSGSAGSTGTGATIIVMGRVENIEGPIAGAIVGLKGTSYQKAVTNSNGEYRLTVPASSETVTLTASFAGYKDVTITVPPTPTLDPIRLTDVQIIEVGRKQQLKRYIKDSQKQARRELRQLHRG